MEIRNDAEALKALLGVSSAVSSRTQQVQGGNGSAAQPVFSGDHATVSRMGAEVSQAADDRVRLEKVVAVQQALAAGTYNVAADAVADKLIDAMVSGGVLSGK